MTTIPRSAASVILLAVSACSAVSPSSTPRAARDESPRAAIAAVVPHAVATALQRDSGGPILVVIEGGETVCHASGCKPRSASLLDADDEIRALASGYRTVRLDERDGAAFVDARLERHGELVRLGPKQVIAGQPPLPGAFVLDKDGDVADWVSLKGFDAQDNLRRLLASR